jgi:hypothetical protein
MHKTIKRSALRSFPFSLLLTSLVLGLCSTGNLAAQDEASEPAKPAKLFEIQDALEVTIKAPWTNIVRNKKNQDPYPATISYTDELGNAMTLPLTVERRGIKRQELCKFPPIKLRFQKEDATGTTFRGQKSLKMVTHCEKGSIYEQYYLLEMVIYEMYRQLTDYSFRVRPLKISYQDTKNDKVDGPRFAFLIEDDSDVAERHDLKKLKIPRISHRRLESDVTGIFALFQYMIGNVDWAALQGPDPEECCHNVKLIAPRPLADDDWVYPVPYDFDSAGLINAKYAAPPDGLPIKNVTQRLYRGYCWHNDGLDKARELFLQKKDSIMAQLAKEELLRPKTSRDAERYLAKFFDIIADAEDYDDKIRSKCRGKPKKS